MTDQEVLLTKYLDAEERALFMRITNKGDRLMSLTESYQWLILREITQHCAAADSLHRRLVGLCAEEQKLLKEAAFTQVMIPVSIETKCDGNHYLPNQAEIILKGIVTVGSQAPSSELSLKMDAVIPLACQLGDAIRGRKKYKLTLEETEETF